jgi:hypothetical protein
VIKKSGFSIVPLVAIIALSAPSQAQDRETKIRIWFKAFIPSQHAGNPGYIKKTATGTTVIEAPENAALNFVGVKGSCFQTDGRSFSTAPLASARIAVEKVVVVKGRDIVRIEDPSGRPPVSVGTTHNVECDTGKLISSKTQDTNGISVSGVKNSNFVSSFGIQAKSSNPYYPSAVTPKIDMDIVVERRFLKRDIRVYGALGVFPAFEAYYSIDDGIPIKLYALEPANGTTAISLIDFGSGVNTRNFEAFIPLK